MGEDMIYFRSLAGPTTMRWTISILETEADHGYSGTLGASVFAQMVKLMDSVYLQKDGQMMYADVHSFNRRKDDMINNLLFRIILPLRLPYRLGASGSGSGAGLQQLGGVGAAVL